jgi:polysaccharide pyruvyl transferase WcaK-like protein
MFQIKKIVLSNFLNSRFYLTSTLRRASSVLVREPEKKRKLKKIKGNNIRTN